MPIGVTRIAKRIGKKVKQSAKKTYKSLAKFPSRCIKD